MSLKRYESYQQSGADWLGSIPGHWSAMRVKTLFEIQKKIAGDLGHNVLSVTQQGLKIRDTDSNDGQLSMDYSKYQLVEPGDFVMNHMDLLTGYVDVSKFHGVTSPDYRVFTARKKAISPGFFLYLFQNGYQQRIFYAFGQGASGLGRWRMPTDSFNDFILPVPPLLEQIAIVTFLDHETAKIDALVADQQRLIGLLREKREAVVSHAVARGLDPNVQMKESGLDWPSRIPAHWEVLPLARVVRQFVDYRGKTPTKIEEGVPLVTATQIKEGRVDHTLDPVFISEEEYAERMTRGFPEKGDVLITTEAPLGETAQIEEERVALGQRIILMKPNKSKVTGDYLFTHFRSQFGQNELWKRASGSTASGIRADRLRASAVLVPPRDEQIAIVNWITEHVSHFPPIEIAIHRQIELLQERRAALISAAVTGKIDVRGLVTNTPVSADSKKVRLVVAAEIVERLSQKASFGRVKLQKLTYLTEVHAGVSELEGNYLRAAAGPLDRDMIAEMEAQLQQAGHTLVDQPGGQGKQVIYKFHGKAGAYRKELTTILAERKARFLNLIDDLGDLETKSVEAVATLYAVWNDVLIDGHTPTDDAVVSGVLEEWHPDKTKKFRAAELHEWLGWMRRHNLVPEGKGPRTSTGRLFL
jgi:type I restriction enzyme, S subunit